ncbi:MAG: urease accessory protein [Nitrospirota bacterium]|nr:urease accessory protein [Nitrospirota bacterium]
MLTLLSLGFVLGMRHALEADHAAAVASLALRNHSMSHTLKQGLAWGMGHTITLLAFSSVVLLLGSVIPARFAQGLEFGVGLMLVGLGLDVIRRLRQEQMHFHVHQHPDRPPHVHAHSHKGEARPTTALHEHPHPHGFPYRALLVGLMHGMAGSAALILLTLHTAISPGQAVGYILVFGLGSTLGMGLLSLVMAIPLWYSAHSLTRVHRGLQTCVGIGTTVLGLAVTYQNMGWLLG